jgi:hypothetical protein
MADKAVRSTSKNRKAEGPSTALSAEASLALRSGLLFTGWRTHRFVLSRDLQTTELGLRINGYVLIPKHCHLRRGYEDDR